MTGSVLWKSARPVMHFRYDRRITGTNEVEEFMLGEIHQIRWGLAREIWSARAAKIAGDSHMSVRGSSREHGGAELGARYAPPFGPRCQKAEAIERMLDLASEIAEKDDSHRRRVDFRGGLRGPLVHNIEQLTRYMGLCRKHDRACRDSTVRTDLDSEAGCQRFDGGHRRAGSHRRPQFMRKRAGQGTDTVQPRKESPPRHSSTTAATVQKHAGDRAMFGLHLHQPGEHGRCAQLIRPAGIEPTAQRMDDARGELPSESTVAEVSHALIFDNALARGNDTLRDEARAPRKRKIVGE
jgi:hypothetical protein